MKIIIKKDLIVDNKEVLNKKLYNEFRENVKKCLKIKTKAQVEFCENGLIIQNNNINLTVNDLTKIVDEAIMKTKMDLDAVNGLMLRNNLYNDFIRIEN